MLKFLKLDLKSIFERFLLIIRIYKKELFKNYSTSHINFLSCDYWNKINRILLSSVIDKFSFKFILNDTIIRIDKLFHLFNNLKLNEVTW